MIFSQSTMDLVYGFHQVHSLLRRLIDSTWFLAYNDQIALDQKLQIGNNCSEVEVRLIYHSGFARPFYANSKDLGDDFISISFHDISPTQSQSILSGIIDDYVHLKKNLYGID